VNEIGDLRAKVRMLEDREAIRDVFITYAAAMDGKDWDLLGTVWADDVVFDHSAYVWDGLSEAIWRGKADVMKQTVAGVSRHFTAHHILTNHRMRIDGDRAKAVVYLHSVHLDDPLKPEEHGDHGAWYLAELVRRPDGWKIRRLTHMPVWFSGVMRASGPATQQLTDTMRDFLKA
jgi:hypothetical protein